MDQLEDKRIVSYHQYNVSEQIPQRRGEKTASHELKTLRLAINMLTDTQSSMMFFIDNSIVTTPKRRNGPPIKFAISPRKGKIFCGA